MIFNFIADKQKISQNDLRIYHPLPCHVNQCVYKPPPPPSPSTLLYKNILRNPAASFVPVIKSYLSVNAHANGRNIAGQQHPTILGPTCCVRLHGKTKMFALVAYSLKPVKRLAHKIPTFLLFCDRRLKRSATMLRPFAWNHNNVGLVKTSAYAHCKDYCISMHRFFRRPPTMLEVVAFVCMHHTTSAAML